MSKARGPYRVDPLGHKKKADEALNKMAENARELGLDYDAKSDHRLMEQPAQQEPVAAVSGYYGGQCVILPIDPARIFNSNTALYTSPQPCPTCEALARTVMLDQTSHAAQRTWVGLTDEERRAVWDSCERQTPTTYVKAIEAKLKEKNNG